VTPPIKPSSSNWLDGDQERHLKPLSIAAKNAVASDV